MICKIQRWGGQSPPGFIPREDGERLPEARQVGIVNRGGELVYQSKLEACKRVPFEERDLSSLFRDVGG